MSNSSTVEEGREMRMENSNPFWTTKQDPVSTKQNKTNE
jgi:hypothetical protein